MTPLFETKKLSLVILAISLSTIACAQQYDPVKSSASASSVNIDTAVHPIYRAYKFYTTTVAGVAATGIDIINSPTQTVQTGFKTVGAELNLLTAPSDTRTLLYECIGTNPAGQPVFFVSKDHPCSDGTFQGPLGYVEKLAAGPAQIAVYICEGAGGSVFQADIPPGTTSFYSTDGGHLTTTPETCLGTGPKTLVGYTL